jgi:nucleoside recognition membrane protein YjiH
MTDRTAGAVNLGPRAVLRFVLPSLASLLLFLVPFRIDGESTILVAELAAFLREGLAPVLPALILFIAGVSALASLVLSLRRRERGLLGMLFCVRWYWVVLRLAGATIAAMVLLGAGPEFLRGDSTGGTMVRQLVPNVMTLFLAVIFLLPLMTEYGIMEFTGVLLSRFFRRLFRLPGRGAIDAMASWLGAAPLGVLVTMQQYERGSYNRREALSIVSSFSLASVAFCLLIASILDITAIFLPFYASVAIVSVVLAMVVCRLPPLSRVPETYHRESSDDEAVPAGEALGRWALRQAVDRAARAHPVATQVKHSAVRLLDLWFGLIPTVIAIGTLALALAEYTPVFSWIAWPFERYLALLGVPEAAAAAPSMVVGFADMILPAVLGQGIESEFTRFIIAGISVTQVIYLSEIGALLLRSSIETSVGQLAGIFLVRTVLALPLFVILGHLFLD